MSTLTPTRCCEALFASDLQSSEHPAPTQVRETIEHTLETLGEQRCVEVMAQEYGQRGGGVPDLFLWRVGEGEGERGEVKFAEVKSENDRLSDTQRLWIHVLSGAGVRVELCAAVAKEVVQK